MESKELKRGSPWEQPATIDGQMYGWRDTTKSDHGDVLLVPKPASERSAPIDLSRTIALFSALVRLVGAIGLLTGAVSLYYEAHGFKYDDNAWELKWYNSGRWGWGLISVGFILVAFDDVTTFLFSMCTGFGATYTFAHPETQPFDASRQAIFAVGNIVCAIGAGMAYMEYPVFEGDKIEQMTKVADFYNSRFEDTTPLVVIVVGAAIRAFSILVQIFAGDGLNVFYILPFTRCGMEYENAGESGKHVLTDKYAMICGTVSCMPFAIFMHNWLGAFRMHVHASSIFFLIGIGYSLWNVDEQFYVPFSPETHDVIVKRGNSTEVIELTESIYHGMYQLVVHWTTNNVTYNEEMDWTDTTDTGYYMFVSAIFFVTSETLHLVSSLAYFIGVARNEAPIPGNHVVDKTGGISMCCP
jgi:hypothetical protein